MSNLSFSLVLSLSVLTISCRTVPVSTLALNENVSVEEKSEQGNYLLKNDGSKVYGKKIKGMYGLAVKDYISIDGQKFKPSEIIGYREGNFSYGRLHSNYAKRIVRGNINIYQTSEMRNETSSATNITRQYVRNSYYYQKGDNGELILFGDKDIKELVKGCPKAEAMADKSSKELRKAVRNNLSYVNQIFEVYNKECKPS